MQCEEEEAYELLKHLMFRRKMRANYLPDMKQFQLQLYQLSRLLRDKLPNLYKWLDLSDVSPTLYAAPWILTIFSSQFPLGFVTRIFGKSFHSTQNHLEIIRPMNLYSIIRNIVLSNNLQICCFWNHLKWFFVLQSNCWKYTKLN